MKSDFVFIFQQNREYIYKKRLRQKKNVGQIFYQFCVGLRLILKHIIYNNILLHIQAQHKLRTETVFRKKSGMRIDIYISIHDLFLSWETKFKKRE